MAEIYLKSFINLSNHRNTNIVLFGTIIDSSTPELLNYVANNIQSFILVEVTQNLYGYCVCLCMYCKCMLYIRQHLCGLAMISTAVIINLLIMQMRLSAN